MFSSKALVCGVIGNPVGHSLSPLLHRVLSDEMKADLAYVPFNVENHLESAVSGAFALGIAGLNITIPYKTEVMKYIREIDSDAEKIGAVNTLKRVEGGFKGYNTDVRGLQRSMENAGISLENKKVIVLGAGGAAKAVLNMCAGQNTGEIRLVNRNADRALKLIDEIKKDSPDINLSFIPLESLNKSPEEFLDGEYIAFQSSSVGMHPVTEECIIKNEKFFDRISFGMDLIYTPYTTKFMEKLNMRNVKNINGLDMLVYQGAAAWEIWTGIQADENAVKKAKDALISALEKRGSI